MWEYIGQQNVVLELMGERKSRTSMDRRRNRSVSFTWRLQGKLSFADILSQSVIDALSERYIENTDYRLMGKANRSRRGKLVQLWRNQRGKCYLCGGQMALRLGKSTTATIEHVKPGRGAIRSWATFLGSSRSYSGFADPGRSQGGDCR